MTINLFKINKPCASIETGVDGKKNSAPSEDRTHDLQITLSFVIMRLTRYLLRYQGTCSSQVDITIYTLHTVYFIL